MKPGPEVGRRREVNPCSENLTMRNPFFFPLALALTLACLTCAASQADAQVSADRLVWRHNNGHFENTSGNKWTEVSGDGTFHFREVARRVDHIELYDASRACRVRLSASKCYVKFGNGPYRPFYNGYWER